MKIIEALFGIGVALAIACFAATPAHAHDWFTGLKNNDGGSCCDGEDCRKNVRAWPDENGIWHFIWPIDGHEYTVDPAIIHPDNENPEPFNAAACVWRGKPLCFWRKRTGG
jgi:hypothetical protein